MLICGGGVAESEMVGDLRSGRSTSRPLLEGSDVFKDLFLASGQHDVYPYTLNLWGIKHTAFTALRQAKRGGDGRKKCSVDYLSNVARI
jgi:hypothetical protein